MPSKAEKERTKDRVAIDDLPDVDVVLLVPSPGVLKGFGLSNAAEAAVVIPLGVIRGIKVDEVNRAVSHVAKDVEVVAVKE